LAGAAAPASAQPGPAREQRVQAIERLIARQGEESLRAFAADNLTQGFQESMPEAQLLELLADVRKRCHGFGGVLVEPAPDGGMTMKLMLDTGAVTLAVTTDPRQNHRISKLEITGEDKAPTVDPITWDNYAERFAEEAEAWLNGTILLVRDGKTEFHGSFGLASKDPEVQNTNQTIYAMGSVPIDFTHVAILHLIEQGKLAFDAPLSRFFPEAPADKRRITVRQLLRSESGLQDFHDREGDWDHDLAYIDRGEAMRRIFEGELLFEPGTGREHSHSAWGVLAAIVEIVAGQDYGAYLQQHLFAPLRMTRTGLYPLAKRFPTEEIAVGLSANGVGDVNAPTHWGETSWLVMGSGGMVSTPEDMGRWIRGVRDGGILSASMQKEYYGEGGGIGVAGNDRGFYCSYRIDPDNFFVFCSNAHTSMIDHMGGFTRALAGLFANGSEREQ